MRLRSAILAFVAAFVAALAVAAPASAAPEEPLRIVNLTVQGGAESWHPLNNFRLEWDRPGDGAPAAGVHWLVRGAAETIAVPEDEIPGEVTAIGQIHLPGPGRYRVEVWLEGPDGEMGPVSAANLLFDDVAPGDVPPLGVGEWLAGDSRAVLRFGRPGGPLPVSGIRGYAVSVDRGTGRQPCEDPVRCTSEEVDLNGGPEDNTFVLDRLAEGTTFVRVVAVSGSGVHSKTVRSAALRVDATRPEVELRGAPAGWSDHPVELHALATDRLSGMAPSGPAGPYTAIAIDGRTAIAAFGASVSATVRGEGAHRVAYYARDAAGNVADGEAGAPAPARTVLGIDETAPRVAFLDSQDPSEPERIEAIVGDALSGPSPDRGSIAVRPAGSVRRFEQLPTTVSAGRLVARWDSDRYPRGAYEFRATAYDAAGNQARGDRRLGGARMVLPNPLKQPSEIVSGLGGRRLLWRGGPGRAGARRCRLRTIEALERRPAARTVPYGHGTAFGGRLTTAGGAALGGMPVTVTETFAAGAGPALRTTVTHTRANGTFSVHLAPGPTRRVAASFAGTRTVTAAGGPPTRFAVLSSVRLRASTSEARVGGAPVLFSGRVGRRGTSIPVGGMAVELQFRLPGSGWSEFRTVQTDAAGRFRYRYAFSDDDSRGVRFQFRAYLAGRPGWPYEPAASRPVLVTGS